ncbi:MAG: hypothetical protein U1E77_21365 [Inhella sp.]
MSFHLYRITEIYSNPSGTVQFIELSVGNANGESQWSGVRLQSLAGAETAASPFPAICPAATPPTPRCWWPLRVLQTWAWWCRISSCPMAFCSSAADG